MDKEEEEKASPGESFSGFWEALSANFHPNLEVFFPDEEEEAGLEDEGEMPVSFEQSDDLPN